MNVSATITRPDGQTTNLPFAHNIQWLEEIDGVGSGSVTIPKSHAPQAGLGEYLYVGNRIDILVDGSVKGSFLLEEMNIAIVDEEETIVLSGSGMPAVLGEAVVYPGDPVNPSLDDPEVRALSGTPGTIMRTLVLEAQSRGALADITMGFLTGSDSYGVAWPDTIDIEVKEGSTYHQTFRRLQELGHVDFWFEGRELNAAPVRGIDRTATVRIQPGRDVGLSRYSGEGPLRNATLFRWGAGLDNVTYPTAGLHRRSESYLNLRDARDAASATNALIRHHGTYANQADSFTLELVPGEWPTWWVGDTISIRDQFGSWRGLVVTAVSVQQQPDGELLLVPTLGIERPPLEANGLVSDDWEPTSPGARPATLVIAASDSSEAGRAGADLVCTGVDDQDTINAAITAVAELPVDGTILLLEGTYSTSGAILMRNGTALRGMGESTVIDSNHGDAAIRSGETGAYNYTVRVEVSDLRIDGNKSSVSAAAIALNANGARYTNLVIYGSWKGITGSGATNAFGYDIHVNGCTFSSIERDAVALEVGGLVSGNRFFSCTTGVSGGRGLVVSGNAFSNCDTSIRVDDADVIGNVIRDAQGIGIETFGGGTTIVGNVIIGNAAGFDAIAVQPSQNTSSALWPSDVIVANNVISKEPGGSAWRYGVAIPDFSGVTALTARTQVLDNAIVPGSVGADYLDEGVDTVIRSTAAGTAASQVSFAPAGWVSDTDVQATIESLISRTLDSIDDVDAPAPSDGDVLTYDSATSTWIPAATASAPATLDELTDVSAAAPTDGDSLIWDAATSTWVPSAVSGGGGASTLDDLTDVDTPSPADGQALTWNATTSAWEATTLSSGSGPIALDDLTDASITAPADGDVLTYDAGTSTWVPSTPSGGGGSSTLDGLTDVSASAPADGAILQYDAASGTWVSVDIPPAGLTASPLGGFVRLRTERGLPLQIKLVTA